MNRNSSSSSNRHGSREGLITFTARDGLPIRAFRTQELDPGHRAIQRFIHEFREHQKEWETLKTTALKIINKGLSDLGIQARVTSRVKSVASLQTKLYERNRIKPYIDGNSILNDQIDFVGLRISLFFPSQQLEVVEMLKKLFNYDSTRSFHRDWKPRKWLVYHKTNGEYAADHIWLHLNQKTQTHMGISKYGKYGNQRFEVQLRSLLMDAWSSMSHDLEYKSLTGTLSIAEHGLLDLLKGSVEKGNIEIQSLVQTRKAQHRTDKGKQLPSTEEFGRILAKYLLPDRSQGASQDDIDLFIRMLREAAPAAPPQVGKYLIKCAEQLTELRNMHGKRLETDREPLCLDDVNKLLTDHTPTKLLMKVPKGNTGLLLSMLKRMNANTPPLLRHFMLHRNIKNGMKEDMESWGRGSNLLPPTTSLYTVMKILRGLVREDFLQGHRRAQSVPYRELLMSTAQKDWRGSDLFDLGDSFHSHSLSQALIWLYHVFYGPAGTPRLAPNPFQVEWCAKIWTAFLWIRTYRPKDPARLRSYTPARDLFQICDTCGHFHRMPCLHSINFILELSFSHLLPNPLDVPGSRDLSHNQILNEQNKPIAKSQKQHLFDLVRLFYFRDTESWNRGVKKFYSETKEPLKTSWKVKIDDSVLLKMRIATWLACIQQYDLLQEYIDPKCNLAGTSRGFYIMQKLHGLAIKFKNEEVKSFTASYAPNR